MRLYIFLLFISLLSFLSLAFGQTIECSRIFSINTDGQHLQEYTNTLQQTYQFPKIIAERMIKNNEQAIPYILSGEDIPSTPFYFRDNARPYNQDKSPRLNGLDAIVMYRGLALTNLQEFSPNQFDKNGVAWMSPEFHVAYEYAAGEYKPTRQRFNDHSIGIIIEYRFPRSMVVWRSSDHRDMYLANEFEGYIEAFVFQEQIRNIESYMYKIYFVKNGSQGRYLNPNTKWVKKSAIYKGPETLKLLGSH